ncbi:hypothetical protein GCM10010249_30540 [Streptomyces roseolilacinus]|uniref:Uncharacterized protein n=1 Tax=Streptomyces roseolilacinus TaxID=66904 RepID=A0A918EMB6_9ACTN|nr:hypothetical protein GCM10010249_30540 [Streptomyces roseolilacinus]
MSGINDHTGAPHSAAVVEAGPTRTTGPGAGTAPGAAGVRRREARAGRARQPRVHAAAGPGRRAVGAGPDGAEDPPVRYGCLRGRRRSPARSRFPVGFAGGPPLSAPA